MKCEHVRKVNKMVPFFRVVKVIFWHMYRITNVKRVIGKLVTHLSTVRARLVMFRAGADKRQMGTFFHEFFEGTINPLKDLNLVHFFPNF